MLIDFFQTDYAQVEKNAANLIITERYKASTRTAKMN